jgi:hypothetical protein
MNKSPILNKGNHFIKYLHLIELYTDLVISLVDYFSINGKRLNKNKNLIPVFDSQFRSGLRFIIVEKIFFKNNRSLLLELLSLSPAVRSHILIITLSMAFEINLTNKKVTLT